MSDAYLQGVDRKQCLILPESVEDYVSEVSLVRVIDAFVDNLPEGDKSGCLPNLREMGGTGGRKGYHPRAMAKLLIWGYINRVRSTRRLETDAGRNLELIWLLRKLQPDHSSISRFRASQAKRIKQWLREFNLLCKGLDLLGGEEEAVDGAFLKAVNSKANNHTQGKLEKQLKSLDKKIDEYLARLAQSEQEGSSEEKAACTAEELKEKLEELKQKQAKLHEMREAAKKSPTGQLSTVDEESRLLKKKTTAGSGVVGFLAQTAVDGKEHLIVAAEVSCAGSEKGHLTEVVRAAKEVLPEKKGAMVLADGMYFTANDITACEKEGFLPIVPPQGQKKSAAKAGLYPLTDFRYEKVDDRYRCPQGQVLTRHADYEKGGAKYQTYYNTAACKACPLREKCVSGKAKYRKIHRHENQEAIDRMRKRMEASPEIYPRRGAIVEHPFGSMLFWNEGRNLLCRGQEKAQAEFSLSCLAYNIKRAIKVLGVARILEGIRAHLRSLAGLRGMKRAYTLLRSLIETAPETSREKVAPRPSLAVYGFVSVWRQG
jgi:transposase